MFSIKNKYINNNISDVIEIMDLYDESTEDVVDKIKNDAPKSSPQMRMCSTLPENGTQKESNGCELIPKNTEELFLKTQSPESSTAK